MKPNQAKSPASRHRWIVGALVVLVAGFYIHALNDFAPLDIYSAPVATPARLSDNATVDEHFSETYYTARAAFRTAAHAARIPVRTLPLPHLPHLDLTIDVAVLAGAKDRVLVHISGTHGVEGFAGSGIQNAIVRAASTWRRTKDGPTVLLVHALNPFGFSQLRRFNEHNVDLNRNWLRDEDFARLQAQDPNANGFIDVWDALHPPTGGSPVVSGYVPRLARVLLNHGLGSLKRAIVSGNYHFPQSIFFGGGERQPSLRILEGFLEETVDFAAVRRLGIIDVHTGLGRAGEDTLILTSSCHESLARRVFAEEGAAQRVASVKIEGDDSSVLRGYGNATGFVVDGIAGLLLDSHRPGGDDNTKTELITLAQEFGTVPLFFGTRAMVEENAYFHHAPGRRLPFAERLRDAFYVHRSPSWKASVLTRGLAVFGKLYEALSNS